LNLKFFVRALTATLLSVVSLTAVSQPPVSSLPQSVQPKISEQTKALFRQRWADDAATAANSSATNTAGVATQVVPATARPSASAANPPSDNRANQQAYIDQVSQALKSGKGR